MTVLKRDGRTVEDAYLFVPDDAELPTTEKALLVSLSRWERERDSLAARGGAFGLRLPNTAQVRALDPAALLATLIVLEFPGFADGRAYSQAHQLREARAYSGEIRATGAAVVRDQILGMARCGIDAFELRPDQSVEACVEALREFSLAYQPGVADDPLPLVRRNRRTATK